MSNNQLDQQEALTITTEPKSFYRKTKYVVVVLSIVALLFCIGIFAICTNKNFIRNEKPVSPSPFPTQSTIKPTLIISQTSLLGKWEVVSIQQDDMVFDTEGKGATIEFRNDGTYQALGGCNEMAPRKYNSEPGNKLTFEVGGTKMGCLGDVVEFWDLNKVSSYKFSRNTLVLLYKNQFGRENSFWLSRVKPDSSIDIPSDWETFTSDQVLYSFKYPKDWTVGMEQSLPPIVNLIYFIDEKQTQKWVIKFHSVPEDAQDALGQTYCMAYPKDEERCQTIALSDGTRAGIEWGTKDDNFANITITATDGRKVGGSLTPVNPKSKVVLLQVLATFRFLDNTSSINDSNIASQSCTELEKLRRIETAKLNQDCVVDADCVNSGEGAGCGYCLNKNTNENYLEKIGEIEGVGINKCNWVQLECKNLACQCMDNKCTTTFPGRRSPSQLQ